MDYKNEDVTYFLIGILFIFLVAVFLFWDCSGDSTKGDKDPISSTSTLSVSFKGQSCDPEVSCSALCEELQSLPKTTRIVLNDTYGSHGTVEEFSRCIKDAGFTYVSLFSE